MTTDYEIDESLRTRLRELGAALDAAAPPTEIDGHAFHMPVEDDRPRPSTILSLDPERLTDRSARHHSRSRTTQTRPWTLVAAALVLVAAGLAFGSGIVGNRATVDMASITPAPEADSRSAVADRPYPDLGPDWEIGPTTTQSFSDPYILQGAQAGVRSAEPVIGEPQAMLTIRSLDLSVVVVEGVGVEELKNGPGLYPSNAFPGTAGNAAIAGHRTTYGSPFHDLDKLAVGDVIEVKTVQGTFRYAVLEQPDGAAYRVVEPDQVDVLHSTDRGMLTLTTTHPKYSSRQRLIVQAELLGSPAPTLWPDRASSGSPIRPG